MFLFCAAETGSMQERMVLFSTSTVHAPHCPRPQPNRGPCNDRLLRRTYSSGVLGSASTTLDLPFTFSEIRAMVKFLSRRAGQRLCGPICSSRISISTLLICPLIYTHSHWDGNAAPILLVGLFGKA